MSETKFETFDKLPPPRAGQQPAHIDRLAEIKEGVDEMVWVVFGEYEDNERSAKVAGSIRNSRNAYAGWDASSRTLADGRCVVLVRHGYGNGGPS